MAEAYITIFNQRGKSAENIAGEEYTRDKLNIWLQTECQVALLQMKYTDPGAIKAGLWDILSHSIQMAPGKWISYVEKTQI